MTWRRACPQGLAGVFLPKHSRFRESATVLQVAAADEIYIADRGFCTCRLMGQLIEREISFIFREHAHDLVYDEESSERPCGRCSIGLVLEGKVRLCDRSANALGFCVASTCSWRLPRNQAKGTSGCSLICRLTVGCQPALGWFTTDSVRARRHKLARAPGRGISRGLASRCRSIRNRHYSIDLEAANSRQLNQPAAIVRGTDSGCPNS